MKLAILAAVLGLMFLADAKAAAVLAAQVEDDKVTITLYDEPCKLEAVKNLPFRATWTESGKVSEGCVGGDPRFPVFIFYFEDRTSFNVGRILFKPLVSA